VKPAIDAITPRKAPRCLRLAPRSNQPRKIIRMNELARRSAFQYLERCAEVLQYVAVDTFDFTGGCHESDQGRSAIGDQAIMILARTQRLLGALSVVNIEVHSAPSDDLTGSVD
jgi:hypothetical protein